MPIFRHLAIVLILSLSFPAGLRPAFAQETDPAARLKEMLGGGSIKFYNRWMQPISPVDLSGKPKIETRVSVGNSDPIVGFHFRDSVMLIRIYNPLQINEQGLAAPLVTGSVRIENSDPQVVAAQIKRTLTSMSTQYAEKIFSEQGDLSETAKAEATKETRQMAAKILLAFGAFCVVIGGVILTPELWKTYQTFKGHLVEGHDLSRILAGTGFVAIGIFFAKVAYAKMDESQN